MHMHMPEQKDFLSQATEVQSEVFEIKKGERKPCLMRILVDDDEAHHHHHIRRV